MRSVENSLYRRRWPLCATVRSGKRSRCLIQKDRAYRLHEYLRPYVVHTYVYKLITIYCYYSFFRSFLFYILIHRSGLGEKKEP